MKIAPERLSTICPEWLFSQTRITAQEVLMLPCLSRFFCNLLKNEDGPTAVEYAVMLALIIVVCIAAISTLGSNANSTFGSVGNAVNVGS